MCYVYYSVIIHNFVTHPITPSVWYTGWFFFVATLVLYVQGSTVDRGPSPPDLSHDLVSFVTPVIYDTPTWNHKFGDCIKQPADVAKIGETVTARFVS